MKAVVSIRGRKHLLWRAVDQDGFALEVLVQNRRYAKTAKRMMPKLLKGLGGLPRVIITDKLRTYGAAKRKILPGVEHRSHKGLNNRAEKVSAASPATRADHEAFQGTTTSKTLSLYP
jgi:putative transposase